MAKMQTHPLADPASANVNSNMHLGGAGLDPSGNPGHFQGFGVVWDLGSTDDIGAMPNAGIGATGLDLHA